MDDKSLKQQSASYYIDINDNDKNKENDSCCNSKWVLVVDSPHRESKEQSLQHKQESFSLLNLVDSCFGTMVGRENLLPSFFHGSSL